ncbi:DUF2523 family protein [Nitrincola alkalisediminis]|uniref:DUF2523 family protein n=1 Tax=Nitrincola alkalisediminis TaxID=1366656 RepID=UPI001876DFBF|nr:DUF2523 family protein [Nitrincola alkalisediminis]
MINKVLGFFKTLWENFLTLMRDVLLTLFDAIKEVFFYLFDMILLLVISTISGIGELGSFAIGPLLNQLPPEAKQVLAAVGFVEAMGMISAALVIRLILQLIPFVRLGS